MCYPLSPAEASAIENILSFQRDSNCKVECTQALIAPFKRCDVIDLGWTMAQVEWVIRNAFERYFVATSPKQRPLTVMIVGDMMTFALRNWLNPSCIAEGHQDRLEKAEFLYTFTRLFTIKLEQVIDYNSDSISFEFASMYLQHTILLLRHRAQEHQKSFGLRVLRLRFRKEATKEGVELEMTAQDIEDDQDRIW